MPYRVEVEWDGCQNDEHPVFQGSREECLSYMRRFWWMVKGKQTLALVNNATGRCESFVL